MLGSCQRVKQLVRHSASLSSGLYAPESATLGTPNAVRKVLALDWGLARIGVALSDDLGLLAHPRDPIDAKDAKKALARIAALAEDEKVELVLVGLPMGHTGAATGASDKARRFALTVANATGLDVHLVDERLSTSQAHRMLKDAEVRASHRKQKVDGAAAAILLQAWLDARR